MSTCRVFSCVVGRGCLQRPVHFLSKTRSVFALLHSVFQGQICLLLQVFLRRRQWHPTPVFLPGKSHGWRRLVGCSPWGCFCMGLFKSQTQLSDFTFTFHFHALEKEMATHSSVLAWRIPRMGCRVGCHLWGRTESDTTEATQQQQQPGVS